MPLSEKDRTQLEDEHLDPRRLNLACEIHGYYGPYRRDSNFRGALIVPPKLRKHPALGCSACMKVFYVFDILSVPPSERAQRLEELEEVIAKMVEFADRGQFNFIADRHPTITYDN